MARKRLLPSFVRLRGKVRALEMSAGRAAVVARGDDAAKPVRTITPRKYREADPSLYDWSHCSDYRQTLRTMAPIVPATKIVKSTIFMNSAHLFWLLEIV